MRPAPPLLDENWANKVNKRCAPSQNIKKKRNRTNKQTNKRAKIWKNMTFNFCRLPPGEISKHSRKHLQSAEFILITFHGDAKKKDKHLISRNPVFDQVEVLPKDIHGNTAPETRTAEYPGSFYRCTCVLLDGVVYHHSSDEKHACLTHLRSLSPKSWLNWSLKSSNNTFMHEWNYLYAHIQKHIQNKPRMCHSCISDISVQYSNHINWLNW